MLLNIFNEITEDNSTGYRAKCVMEIDNIRGFQTSGLLSKSRVAKILKGRIKNISSVITIMYITSNMCFGLLYLIDLIIIVMLLYILTSSFYY